MLKTKKPQFLLFSLVLLLVGCMEKEHSIEYYLENADAREKQRKLCVEKRNEKMSKVFMWNCRYSGMAERQINHEKSSKEYLNQ